MSAQEPNPKKRTVELGDIVSLAGLVLIGAGVGMLSIPAMLITEGALLLVIGLIGALRR